jgi:hypothetical protein
MQGVPRLDAAVPVFLLLHMLADMQISKSETSLEESSKATHH